MTSPDSLDRPIVMGSRPSASSVPERGPEVMTRRWAVWTLAFVPPAAVFAPAGSVETGACFMTGSVGPAAPAGTGTPATGAAAGVGKGDAAAWDSGSLRTRW